MLGWGHLVLFETGQVDFYSNGLTNRVLFESFLLGRLEMQMHPVAVGASIRMNSSCQSESYCPTRFKIYDGMLLQTRPDHEE